MSEIDNEDLPAQDELTALKARADLLGLSYHPSIGVEKLRTKINDALADEPAEEEPKQPQVVQKKKESLSDQRMSKRREAGQLIRIRVSCMNPAKNEWEGELFTCGNAVVGTYTRYVPFNAEDGWHVPRIIYNMMIERQCQIFTSIRDARGNTTRKGKLIKEFAIEVLPPLTPEELAELARRQAASHAID